jgi:D-alanyl-D-alanine carboxypeptidase (penicillin-binding protein 5/6)
VSVRRLLSGLALCLGGALAPALVPAAAVAQPSTVPASLAQLQAREAILVETDTGATLFARNAQTPVPIASTTKLMTAYVTLEYEPLERKLIEQPYYAEAGESLADLTPGRAYTVASLLRGLLIPSGNDAAHTLAIDVGGTDQHFLAMMNAAAAQLGLDDTHYTTPVGLDTPGNYSTATDLAKLAQVLMRNWFFAKVVREPQAVLPYGTVLVNSDDLIGTVPWLVGVKTGHTAGAGYCLVGAASAGGVHLVSVVLGDPSNAARDADTLALLRYGLHLYRNVPIAVAGRTYVRATVNGSSTEHVALVAAHSESLTVTRQTPLEASLVGVPSTLQGPIAAGTPEGAIVARENGRVTLTIPLLTQTAVAGDPGSSLLVKLLIALAVALAASLLLMRRRARRAVRRGAPR